MLVIDTSALVDVLTAEPSGVRRLAWRVHDAEWMSAPDLLDYEVLNVLRRMVLRGDIDDELAEQSRSTIRQLRLTRHAMTDQMSDRVWQLRHSIATYDASYVALAEQLEVPLVTSDRRLVAGAQDLTPVPLELYAANPETSV